MVQDNRRDRTPQKWRARSRADKHVTVTATEAQNQFGRMLDTAVGDQAVFITKHNRPQAVLVSIDRFNELSRVDETMLDTLTEEFDSLLEQMQTPGARAGMEDTLAASPKELARAAVEHAKRREP